MNLPQYMPPPIEDPPPLPPGFIGPATLQPILNGVVIGHTAIGNPWFAVPATPMPWATPSRPSTTPTATGLIQLSPEMQEFTKAISEAIRSASPINLTGAPGTATVIPRPVDPILSMCTEHLNSALLAALPHPTAASAAHTTTARRGLSFDGSPGTAIRSSTSGGRDRAVHQAVSRTEFKPFMTKIQLDKQIELISPTHDITSVFASFRDVDKKVVTASMQSATATRLPSAWQNLTVEKGMNDACIESVMAWLDTPMDMLQTLKHAIGGRLVVTVDENLGPEQQKICMQYMLIMQSMLEFSYSPFSVAMNRLVTEHEHTLVYVPASVLCIKDKLCTSAMLSAMPSHTAEHIRSGHASNEPLTVPHVFLAALRFAYQPDKDDIRKISVAKVFLQPMYEYRNYEQFYTYWKKIKREHIELKGRDIHAHDPIEERECILLLLACRSWMKKFKQRWQEKGWPDSTDGLFEKIKNEMTNEDAAVEKSRCSARKIYMIRKDDSSDEEYSINVLGAKDAKKQKHEHKRPTSAPPYSRITHENRGRDRDRQQDRHTEDRKKRDWNRDRDRGTDRDKKVRREHDRYKEGDRTGHTRFTSTREDRRFHTTGSAPPAHRNRNREPYPQYNRERQHVRRYGIGGQSKSEGQKTGSKYLLGPPARTPVGWKCPHCNRSLCAGRCMICLHESSCSSEHKGKCPHKHAKFDQPRTWPREWFDMQQHEPCTRCGHVGHPPAACPRRKDRQVLMRTTMHDGKHRNALVAFLDLKDGQEPPADVEDEAAWLNACETTLSDGCRDHASCGEAHEYDAAHVHTRDTRLDVDTPSMDSQIYLALTSEYGAEREYHDSEFERDEAEEVHSGGSESERSDILPVYTFDDVTHDTGSMSTGGDDALIASLHAVSAIPKGAAVWDCGAMKSVNKDDNDAVGYVQESFAKLFTADGTKMKNKGEADFEMLCETKQGQPHSMLRHAPICPDVPMNIVSAGEMFQKGYGAAHNLDGLFVPKGSYLYNKVRAMAYRREYLEFEKGEHCVVTPDKKQIILQQRRPNLSL